VHQTQPPEPPQNPGRYILVELLGQAEAAYRLVDDATGDYWSRQPDEEDEEDPAED
jgi:hypothetical protein